MHLSKSLLILLGICALVVFLFGFVFLLAAKSPSWYHTRALQTSIADKLARTNHNLSPSAIFPMQQAITNHVLNDKPLNASQQQFFTQKERNHLADVQRRFFALELLTLIALGLLVVLSFLLPPSLFSKILMYGGFVAFFLGLGIAVLLLLAFDKVFFLFHQLLFQNNDWLLNPYQHLLIVLFPSQSFLNFASFFLLRYLLTSLGVFISGFLLHLVLKKLYDINHRKQHRS